MPALAWIQMGLGLATLGVVAALGRRLAGARAGFLAALLLSLYGPLVAAESKRLSTSPGLFLLASSLLALSHAYAKPQTARALRAGCMLGLAVLVRPFFLVYVGVAPLLHWRPPMAAWLRRWIPFGLAVAFLVAPVTLRNQVVGDDWVLISSNGGMTFFQGNNIENRSGLLTVIQRFQVFGSAEQQELMERSVAEEAMGRALKPSETSRFWAGQAFAFMREHPLAWLRLEARKLYRFVTSFEYADNYSFYLERERIWPLRLLVLPFGALLALGVFGAIVGLRPHDAAPAGTSRSPMAESNSGDAAGASDARRGTFRLIVSSALLGMLGCLLFYVSSRYRMETVPALAVLGGLGLHRVLEEGRNGWRSGRVRVGAAVGALVLAASFLPAGAPARSQESITYLHLGNALESLGRLDEARDAFDRSVDLLPQNPFAWKSLLLATARTQGEDAARARLAEIDPETRTHPELLYVEGYLFAQTGDRVRAIDALQRAVSAQPLMREGHARLAQLLEDERDYAGAAYHLGESIRLRGEPDDVARRHRIYLLIQARRYEEAKAFALEMLAQVPDDNDVRLNLAIAEFYLGHLDTAAEALEAVITQQGSATPADGGAAPAEAIDPVTAYYRGVLRLRQGEFPESVRWLARVVEVAPQHQRALYYGQLARAAAERNGEPVDAQARRLLSFDAWKSLLGDSIESARGPWDEWVHTRAGNRGGDL